MNTRRIVRNLVVVVALAGVLAGALTFLAGAAGAAPVSQTAPTSEMKSVRCWRTILQADDMLCIGQYNLPQQNLTTYPIPTPVTTSSAWCAYLAVQAGCTSTSGAVSPDDPTSLQYGTLSAWFTICSVSVSQVGCTGEFENSLATPVTGGTLHSQDRVPRIGAGIAGHYFSPGHGLWNISPVPKACIEPTGDFSATSTTACQPLTFNGLANNQATQRDQMQKDVLAFIVNVQTARGLAKNAYITGSKINAAGRILALEAYPYMDILIPDAFQAAAEQAVKTPYSGTPAGAVVLETRIAGTVTASAWGQRAERAGSEWGISGGFWTTLVFMMFGAVAAWGTWRWVGSTDPNSSAAPVLGVLVFGAVTFLGVFLGGPSLSVVIVTIVILSMIGGWFVLARLPSG